VYSLDGIRNVIETCELIAGGENALRRRPIVSFITSWMISPLRFNTHVTSFLIEICRRRMPVVLSCAPIAGITAPVTIAGMLSQTIAEQLAGIALTQIVSPGTPVIPGPIPAIADMRTGTYLSGSAEMGLANAAVAQILHSYGFPLYNSSGMTDSKLPDIQAGAEKAMSLVVDALSGANYIHHAAGLLENMTTVAPEQYVIDNEIIGMSLRIVKGIEVNEETLAVDAVHRTGPGGIYLMDDLTLRHMRDEFFYPSFVISREMRDLWRMAGKEDARRRARQVAFDFITHHAPVPIDPEIDSLIIKRYKPVTDLHQNKTKPERMEP
jgi:trimethylamine--corrinoid protein Co-methyltransferase